jgi:preprotein translocase subunit YajC
VGGSGFLIVLLGMFAVMYFLLIRPQKAKQRQMQEMLNRIAPGDEVITIGGIYGDVIEVEEDKVVLEIAEDVHIEVTRRAIANIVPPEVEEPDEPEEPDGEPADEAEPEAGELAPAADEAPEPDAGTTEDEKVEERTR